MVGQKKSGGHHKKATAWWNEETIQATKLKKAIIQEVAERSNTTEQRTVSLSQPEMHANKSSNRPKKRHGQSIVTNWMICGTQRR